MIRWKKCKGWWIIPLKKCSDCLFIPLKKCNQWGIEEGGKG